MRLLKGNKTANLPIPHSLNSLMIEQFRKSCENTSIHRATQHRSNINYKFGWNDQK